MGNKNMNTDNDDDNVLYPLQKNTHTFDLSRTVAKVVNTFNFI